MRGSTQRYYHSLLAATIEQILRAKAPLKCAQEIAYLGGLSRSHFSRTFRKLVNESVSHFAGRISLERAAFILRHTRRSVAEVAGEAGYGSSEAFCRSFKSAFGVSPGSFRTNGEGDWKIPCESDLHWNPDLVEGNGLTASRYKVNLVVRPPTRHAFIRFVGDYRKQAEGWQRLADLLGDSMPRETRFMIVYRANLWSFPATKLLRADIGFAIPEGVPVFPGMRSRTLAPGLYAATRDLVPRQDRTDAWSYMVGTWVPRDPRVTAQMNYFDEFPELPLPFDKSQSKIFIGISPGAGRQC